MLLPNTSSVTHATRRCCCPADDRTASTALALASAAQDISRLGVELEEQQAAVRQRLMASQALAEGLKRRAALADMSTDQVVGDFFKVYNTALFVADDRNRCVHRVRAQVQPAARKANKDWGLQPCAQRSRKFRVCL